MKLLTLQFLTCAIKSCKSKPKPPPPSSSTDPTTSGSTSPFPLHPIDATLERAELPFNPLFILNILPRLDFDALRITATEFGVLALLPGAGAGETWDRVQEEGWRERMLGRVGELEDREGDVEMGGDEEEEKKEEERGAEDKVEDEDTRLLRGLHTLLLETEMLEGKLRCGSCGHEYGVKEGVGNFLLPAHLV